MHVFSIWQKKIYAALGLEKYSRGNKLQIIIFCF